LNVGLQYTTPGVPPSDADPILQPGAAAFSTQGIQPGDPRLRNLTAYRIGILYRSHNLVFVSDDPSAVNYIDAAIAWTNDTKVKPSFPDDHPGYVLNPEPVIGAIHNTVQKYGSESHLTVGEIIATEASITVNYPNGKAAVFHQQYQVQGRDGRF